MKNPLRLVDKRGLLIVIGGATLITLISVIAIVLTLSGRDREERRSETERRRREQQALTSSTNFGIEDFYLDSRDPEAGIVYPARLPKKSWTSEEVEFYWIDPSEAGIENLSSENDALIFQLLGVDRDGTTP